MTSQSSGAAVPAAGAWQGRPAGMPGAVPPPSVPLSFLAAAAAGLIACGAALAWAAPAAVADPTADRMVAAAHFGMLATLSMAVLGALHQFTPVVTQRPLRSRRLAQATFAAWLAGAWLLPAGFAATAEPVVEAGGAAAAVAVTLLVINLSAPLAARGKGAPVTGLRLAVAGFVATACFGLVYVADRRGGWFSLDGRVVLAHATIGLFAWLGLTYVSVAEKLWPMFFLAHVPGRHRAGWVAVWAVPAGAALLSPGLLAGLPWLAWAGAAVLAAGLGAHLVSLAAHVRHRRRRADLHLLFVITSALWLVAGAGLALTAAVLPGGQHQRPALAAAAVAAFAGWLLETLAGHAHKVVPFIGWSVLRARGVTTGPAGRPLGFGDLYDHRWAAACYGLTTAGLAAVCAGLAASAPAAIAAGGGLLAAAGLVAGANLTAGPLRLLAARRALARAGEGLQAAGRPGGPGSGGSDRPRDSDRSVSLSLIALAAAGTAVIMAAAALWPGTARGSRPAAVAASPAAAPNGQVATFTIQLGDMFVRPRAITVAAGTRVRLQVVNRGSMTHDLQLAGGSVGTGLLGPGQRATADLGVAGHTEQAWCTVPGHKAAGMVLTVSVRGRPAAPVPGTRTAPDAAIDFAASPPPGWRPASPVLAPAPRARVHHVTLVAEDTVRQVAPGVSQDMWTFGGQVPGPVLRGHVGDLFVVTLVNRSRMGHSLDLHAASQPMAAMRTIGPGQSVTERFRARYAGIFLYHCGTAPVLEHVANGMYGAVIIDPPGLRPAAREFLIVQSELYPGPQGQPGDYRKMLRGQPGAVVFNGYVNQYEFAPLRARAGQRVRIWVLDAGPSDDTSFHVVGAQFDTVFAEGSYLLRPGGPARGAAQALGLMPGQGGFAEFTVPAAGRYELLDHHLDHAAAGAAGYLVASP